MYVAIGGKKQKDCTFISTSLFRYCSLIRIFSLMSEHSRNRLVGMRV